MKPNIIIPKSVLEQSTKISKNAFTNTSGKINIGTIDIQDSAYMLDKYYKDFNWQQYANLLQDQADKVLYIPQGTVTIASNIYTNNANLEVVYIPKSVTTIASNAFANCYALHTIIFESANNITEAKECYLKIGSNAFKNCYGLYQIIFPAQLESIGTNAFDGCYKLVEVDIKACPKFSKSESPKIDPANKTNYLTPGDSGHGKVAYYLAGLENILKSDGDNTFLIMDNATGQVYYTGNMRVYDNLKILGTASGMARAAITQNGVSDTITDYKEEHEGIFFIDDLNDTTTKNKFITQEGFKGEALYSGYVYDGGQTRWGIVYGMKFTSLSKKANYVFSAKVLSGLDTNIFAYLMVMEKDKDGNLLNLEQRVPDIQGYEQSEETLNIKEADSYIIKTGFNDYFELTDFSPDNNNSKELWVFFIEEDDKHNNYNQFIKYTTHFQLERGTKRTAYEPHLTKQSSILNNTLNQNIENSLGQLKYYSDTLATTKKQSYRIDEEATNRNLAYKNQQLKFLIHVPVDYLGRAIVKCPERMNGENLYLYNYLLYNNLKVEKLIIEEAGYNDSAEIILGHEAFANLLNVNEIHYNLHDAYTAMSEKYWDGDETEWMNYLFQNLGNNTIKGAIGYIDASKTKLVPPYLFNCRHRAGSSEFNPFIIEYNLLPQNDQVEILELIEAGAFGNNPRLRYLQLGASFQFNNTGSEPVEQNIRPNAFVNCGRLYELRAVGLSKEENLTKFLNRLDSKDYGSIDNNLKKLYTFLEQQRDVYYQGNNNEFIYLYNSDKIYDELIAYDGFIYNVNFPMDTVQKLYNIEHSTFNGLSHIRILNFQNSPINKFGANAFRGLTRITEVELPTKLTFIDKDCFRGDNQLEKVSGHCKLVYDNKNPHTNNIFDGCTRLKYFNWNNIYAKEGSHYTYIPQEQFYNTNLYNFIVPSHISVLNRNCLKITSSGPQALILFEHDEAIELPSLMQWEGSNAPIQIQRYSPSFQYNNEQWNEITTNPYCVWIKKHHDLTVGTNSYKNNWWNKLMQVPIIQKINGVEEIVGYQSYIRYYDNYKTNDDGWVIQIHEVPGPRTVQYDEENQTYYFSNINEAIGVSRIWNLDLETEKWSYINDN